MKLLRKILVVEDDPVDQEAMRRAFKELRINNPAVYAQNGEEALDLLKDSQNEKPCIILLDINMPKMNGLEFLKVVKNSPQTKMIPVVVFTTSQEEQDKIESFGLGVAGYMVKPADHKKFADVIKAIDLYWTVSELPPMTPAE